ncbi:MAG: DUF3127 domain-containing protein [Alistipes sp.]|nr:DUF3127 domain-containing protein [Candidatus Alistipes equi]
MEFEGKCIELLPERTGSSARGGWTIQSAIFETIEQYPKKICTTFFNHQEEFAKLSVNNVYNCSINIESREYNGKWYTDIRVYKVSPKATTATATVAGPAPINPSATPKFQSSSVNNIPLNGTAEEDEEPF